MALPAPNRLLKEPLYIREPRASTPHGLSTLLTLPQTGTENNDHNPDRVKPRNLFDMAFGTDNLFHAEHYGTPSTIRQCCALR
jgi:hypothetical protein